MEMLYIMFYTTSSKSSWYFIPSACLNSPSTFQVLNSHTEIVVAKLDSIELDKMNNDQPALCFPASLTCCLCSFCQIILILHPPMDLLLLHVLNLSLWQYGRIISL